MSHAVDPWGRVVVSAEDLFELFYREADLSSALVGDGAAITQFNALCRAWDKPGEVLAVEGYSPLDAEPQAEIARRAGTWMLDEAVATIDVRQELLDRCQTAAERDRVTMEMDLFEARELLPVLRAMFALVAHFRANGVLWGVGRGSSVASYCLYLIGVHRINSLAFGLDISEFLKP